MARHDRILLGTALWALALLYVGIQFPVDAMTWNLVVGVVLLGVMGYDAWAEHRRDTCSTGAQADTEPCS